MKFPKNIYVTIQQGDNGEFFVAGGTPGEIADHEDTTEAAVYVLTQEVNLVNSTEVQPK